MNIRSAVALSISLAVSANFIFAQKKALLAQDKHQPVEATEGGAESYAGHAVVASYMKALKIADLPEGRDLLQTYQWITGPTDRGENFYSRPEFTSIEQLYAKQFVTDTAGVMGYKELFSMQGVNQAGGAKNFRFLVVAFKDQKLKQWKVFETIDDADGGDNNFDFEHQAAFFKSKLAGDLISSPRDNYLNYAHWLILAGHFHDASSALTTATAVSTRFNNPSSMQNSDPIVDLQIKTLMNIVEAIAPDVLTRK